MDACVKSRNSASDTLAMTPGQPADVRRLLDLWCELEDHPITEQYHTISLTIYYMLPSENLGIV